jgi:hypothetical protein
LFKDPSFGFFMGTGYAITVCGDIYGIFYHWHQHYDHNTSLVRSLYFDGVSTSWQLSSGTWIMAR